MYFHVKEENSHLIFHPAREIFAEDDEDKGEKKVWAELVIGGKGQIYKFVYFGIFDSKNMILSRQKWLLTWLFSKDEFFHLFIQSLDQRHVVVVAKHDNLKQ